MTPFPSFLALGVTDPVTGLFTEQTGPGYARQPLSLVPDGHGYVGNVVDITFAPATSTWPVKVSSYAVYDALSAGNLIMWWDTYPGAAARQVLAGAAYLVRAGRIALALPVVASNHGTPVYLTRAIAVSPLGLIVGGATLPLA